VAAVRRRSPEIVGLVIMIALIVGLDIGFLRHDFTLRLIVNVGIVVVFGAAYARLRLHR